MTILEYIKEYHSIDEQVKRKLKDPVTLVMERDSLPCDDVLPVDGKLQKVVFYTADDYISVVDLLSYSKKDIDEQENVELRETWYAYMENVEQKVLDLEELMSVSKQYVEAQQRKRELAAKCTH